MPFDRIEKSFYEEAVDSGIKQADREIEVIVNQRSRPTFENTIEALENAGEMLNRTLLTFYPILSADGDEEMNQISLRIAPKLAEHSANISLNEKLWQRVKEVYENRDKLDLNTEQKTLLKNTYDSFARSGANLEGADRDAYRKLQAELSELTLKFEQNTVKCTAAYELWLTKRRPCRAAGKAPWRLPLLLPRKKGKRGSVSYHAATAHIHGVHENTPHAATCARSCTRHTTRNASAENLTTQKS